MKQLLTILLLCTLTFPAGSQCYQPLRGEGQALMRQKDYEEAINRYLAALSCPDRPRGDDLPQLIKAALRARVDELEEARRETEEALALARRREREARSAALAAKARQIYPDDQTIGLRLAGAAFRLDPNGSEAAAALRDFFDNRQLHFYRHALWHDDLVEDLAFAPDGKTLVTVSLDSTARLWDPEGNLLRTFPHPTNLNCVAFAPDGSYFLTGAADEIVRKWSPSGELLASFTGFAGGQEGLGITAVDINHSGEILAAGTYGGPLKLMSPEGEIINEIPRLQIDDIAFSPDNSFLFSGGDYNAYLVNTGTDSTIVLSGHTSYLQSVEFSPDGQLIVTTSQDGTARLWNRQGDPLAIFEKHEDMVRHAIFGPGAETVITACVDHKIRVFDLAGDLLEIYSGHQSLVDRLALSPDGQTLASGSFDHSIKMWSLPSVGSETYSAPPEAINQVVWLPDGRRFITNGPGNQSLVRNDSGRVLAEIPGVPLTLAPGGVRVLTDYKDAQLRLCDLEGRILTTFPARDAPILAAAFTPDGQSLAGIDSRGTVFRWNISGELLDVSSGPLDRVYDAVISPDGRFVFACEMDGEAKYWEIGGEILQTIPPDAGDFFSRLAISPDGRYLLTAGSGGTITAWNDQGERVRRFKGLFDGITAIHFTKDQAYVLAACILGPVRIWEFDSGRELQSVYPLQGFASAAAFSPGGKQILIGDTDGAIRIYPRWDALLDDGILPQLTDRQLAEFGLVSQKDE